MWGLGLGSTRIMNLLLTMLQIIGRLHHPNHVVYFSWLYLDQASPQTSGPCLSLIYNFPFIFENFKSAGRKAEKDSMAFARDLVSAMKRSFERVSPESLSKQGRGYYRGRGGSFYNGRGKSKTVRQSAQY